MGSFARECFRSLCSSPWTAAAASLLDWSGSSQITDSSAACSPGLSGSGRFGLCSLRECRRSGLFRYCSGSGPRGEIGEEACRGWILGALTLDLDADSGGSGRGNDVDVLGPFRWTRRSPRSTPGGDRSRDQGLSPLGGVKAPVGPRTCSGGLESWPGFLSLSPGSSAEGGGHLGKRTVIG